MARELRLCLSGFGAVGQRFCRLMQEKQAELESAYGCRVLISGVSTPSRGTLVDQAGLDLDALFAMEEKERRFDRSHPGYRAGDTLDMIEHSGADVLCELSPLSIRDGQPATSYIERAFACGMHVISANKGPIAYHYRRLRDLAAAAGRRFLYETIVLDGTPTFNLADSCLHGNRILGLRGILNGTTNFVLTCLERGIGYADAIKEAQRVQLAEADPSMDVDGWDGAVKICALANILMQAGLTPDQVERESLRHIAPADIERARAQGCRIKYICEARRDAEDQVHLSVKPQLLPLSDLFCAVNGTSAALTFYTDLAGELTMVQTDPAILQTAYGVYSDLLTLLKA